MGTKEKNDSTAILLLAHGTPDTLGQMAEYSGQGDRRQTDAGGRGA